MTVDVSLVSEMPDSSILVKINERIHNLIWEGKSRLESLGRKNDCNRTAFRTTFESSHGDFVIASMRIFREIEMDINGDGEQDLSMFLTQVIMRHKSQLYSPRFISQ